jgi:hypothetical protein
MLMKLTDTLWADVPGRDCDPSKLFCQFQPLSKQTNCYERAVLFTQMWHKLKVADHNQRQTIFNPL